MHSHIRMKDGDKKNWSAYLQHQANVVLQDQAKLNEEMETLYAQEEDTSSYEFVQLDNGNRYEHETDTEDIPDDPYYDPIDLHKKGQRRHGDAFFDRTQYLNQIKAEKLEKDSMEVQDYMNAQTVEDK